VHGDDAGLASGLFNTAQQVGGALGLAVLVTLAASRTSSLVSGLGHHASAQAVAGATVSGYRIAFLVAAAFMLTAILVLVSFLRPRHLEHVVLDGELASARASA
jgi:hypothetical protein